jgi:hypothetical protein
MKQYLQSNHKQATGSQHMQQICEYNTLGILVSETEVCMLVYYVLTSCVHTVLYLVDFSATDVSLRGQQLIVGGLRYGHFHL